MTTYILAAWYFFYMRGILNTYILRCAYSVDHLMEKF